MDKLKYKIKSVVKDGDVSEPIKVRMNDLLADINKLEGLREVLSSLTFDGVGWERDFIIAHNKYRVRGGLNKPEEVWGVTTKTCPECGNKDLALLGSLGVKVCLNHHPAVTIEWPLEEGQKGVHEDRRAERRTVGVDKNLNPE